MPATIGSATIGAAAITGNPPSGPRGKFMSAPRFRVRVLDPVSGAEIISKLPHVVLEYETIFPQLGMAGVSAVGHFVIHLFHTLTDEYAWYKVWYDKLVQLQRVEIYMVDDPDGAGAAGDPVFTGIITNLPKEAYSFRVEGEDSLKLLDLSRTLQADTYTGSTDGLIRYALKTYQLTFGDDFTGNLSAYINNGGWALTTDQGFKSVSAGFAGDGLLFTNASYTNAQYADCFVEAPFHLVCASTAGATAEAGVIAALADVNNFVLGRATMRFVTAASASSPARFEIDAAIFQKVGGAYATVKAQTQAVIVENNGVAQVTVTLQGIQNSATQYTWKLLLNEIDSKCVWTQTVTTGSPTGGVGLRASYSPGPAIVQHHFVFFSKSNAFQPGNIVAGSQRVNQPIASQQNIDLLHLAAATEGNVWRKVPKAGLNNDQIDFGVSVGGDLAGIVRLEEKLHILASQTEPNAEPLNNAVLAAGHPAYNHIGKHRWFDIPAVKTSGLVIGSAVLPQTTDTFSLRQMAQNVLLRRKQPTQAGRMTVLRHEDHAELPGQPNSTGLAYRDGDWVTQHEPSKGIYYKRVQIMSVKVTGGIPTMELTLDQYPMLTDRLPLVDRLNRAVEAAQISRSDQSIQNPANGVSYDRRLVLPINPWRFRVYVTTGQSLTSNTTTKVSFDTVDEDPSNAWDATNFRWVIPVSGRYDAKLMARVDFTASTAGSIVLRVFLVLRRGGAVVYNTTWTNDWGSGAAGSYVADAYSGSLPDQFNAFAGDTLEGQVYQLSGNNMPIVGGGNGGSYTYMAAHLLSG